MSIRQPAAEKLARKMLEKLPPYRGEPLSPEFFTTMAKMIMVYVDMDETQQQREAFDNRSDAALENTSKEK